MKLLSKICVASLTALVLSTSFTAAPAQAEPTPHAVTPSAYSHDLVAFDSAGTLWTYSSTADWRRRAIGTGWNAMRDLKLNDWNQDSIQDIVAVADNGDLYLYYGLKTGGFTRHLIGTGWGSYDISIGKWKDQDQYPSIIAVNLETGILYNYPNLSGAELSPRVVEGRGWGPSLTHHLTDFDSDGKADILAQDNATGKMFLHKTDGNGNFSNGPVTAVGKGWNVMNEVVAIAGYGGDHVICYCPAEYLQTGLLARTEDGILYHYGMSGGGWSTRDYVGTGWNGYTIAGTESPRRYGY